MSSVSDISVRLIDLVFLSKEQQKKIKIKWIRVFSRFAFKDQKDISKQVVHFKALSFMVAR